MTEMEPDDGYSLQEQEEMEQWLSQYDKETVKNLDSHMQRMWESFQSIFNQPTKPKEASNGTDSQKT